MDRRSSRPPGRSDIIGPRFDPIPKPGGGSRWLTRLDPADDAEYRMAVRPLAGRIERALGPEVFAVRTQPSPSGWRLAPWGSSRACWRAALREAIGGATPDTAFAVADIRDCYASIAPETIVSLLGPQAAHATAFLRRLRDRGVRGLPIGPDPSAVLANAVLSELDRAIGVAGARHVRWVDDHVVWGSRHDVRRALDALERTGGTLGLALHEGKTRLLADREEARAVALGERDSSIIAAPP